jgi:hypothetical protein
MSSKKTAQSKSNARNHEPVEGELKQEHQENSSSLGDEIYVYEHRIAKERVEEILLDQRISIYNAGIPIFEMEPYAVQRAYNTIMDNFVSAALHLAIERFEIEWSDISMTEEDGDLVIRATFNDEEYFRIFRMNMPF